MSLLTVPLSALANTTTEKSQSHYSYLLQFFSVKCKPRRIEITPKTDTESVVFSKFRNNKCASKCTFS